MERNINKTKTMTQEFIPLTEDQLIAAEKGELKLKLRNGVKVTQLMWARPPFNQNKYDVLTIQTVDGERILHYKDGRYCGEIGDNYDLLIDHEEIGKLNKQPTEPVPQPKNKCSYGGQLTVVPDKVVHLMLKRQVEQGNKEDVRVFEYDKYSDKDHGGIDWDLTQEKEEYWYKVIDDCNYDLVPDELEHQLYEVGEIIEVREDDDCRWYDAEYLGGKFGQISAWVGSCIDLFGEGNHRKKQIEKTVTIDGQTMTISAAKNYLDTL